VERKDGIRGIARSRIRTCFCKFTRLEKTIMVQMRFSELSAPRQALIRQCQRTGFGKIVGFAVRECEPMLTTETEILFDVKLDGDDSSWPEQNLSDFELSREVVRLFAKLDTIRNVAVDYLEVRGGIPRRLVFKGPAKV
jgi:hypothetical protein